MRMGYVEFQATGCQLMKLPLLILVFLAAPTARAQESRRVVDRIDLQGFEPLTIVESRLTDQSYLPVDANRSLAVVSNRDATVSFLPLGDWQLAGGIDVDRKTGRGYVTLGGPLGQAVGIIDASGTELHAFQLFDFLPENIPAPPGRPIVATNELTGKVFMLGREGHNNAIGVFDASRQEPSLPIIQDLITVPLPDFLPAAIAVNAQTNQVYVPGQNVQGQNILVIVDGEMLSVVDTVVFDEEFFFPLSLAVDETTNRIYVTGNGLTTNWALAEVAGTDHSVNVIPLNLQPYDIGVSEASNEVVIVGPDDVNEGQAFFFHEFNRTGHNVPLGPFAPHGVAVNGATGLVYVGGVDLGPTFAFVVLVLGPSVCDAEPTTIDAIRSQVLMLPTSQETIDALDSSLDAATRSLERDDSGSARLAMTRFIRRLVGASNLEPSDPNALALSTANDLVCSGSNVLVGIQLP